MDTNVDRVKTFLAAHSGQCYCSGCLRIEIVPGLSKIYINQLRRRLRNVKPYRSGKMVCFRCGKAASASPTAHVPVAGDSRVANCAVNRG